jgi:hypothetical protein
MAQDKPPLSDLSFFRFPELTGEVVRNIVLLILLLILTVLVTVALQGRVQRWLQHRSRRSRFAKAARGEHEDPQVRAVLRRLMRGAPVRDEFAFLHDAEAFETAAERLAAEGDDPELAALARLRRTHHLNVMNPELALVSTRQLLQDLPVRLLADIGPEKLDLYCALLRVDERWLLLDLPHEEEIFQLLRQHPQVLLLYWREREGEAVFRLVLEPMEEGPLVLFRARHALRDLDAAHRSAFRLSVDLPAEYQFLERSELSRLRKGGGERHARQGQARVIDLSYGGASVRVEEPLGERGLAQLAFELHGKPMRLMLEVLSSSPLPEGGHLVRGQFRGLGEEARVRLNNVLYREQIKRLRDKELLRIRPGA